MARGTFYWIKLNIDFFAENSPIDFLLSQKNGSEYVVLYIKLCLSTIRTNGRMCSEIGEIIIPYDIEKIARDMKYFSVDTVRIAMELYKKLGLIYREDNGIFTIAHYGDMVGSETKWAEYKRKARKGGLQDVGEPLDNVQQVIGQTVGEPLDNVQQRLETRDKRLDNNLTVSDDTVCQTDVRRAVDEWNKLGVSQVQRITADSKRGSMLRARIREYGIDGVVRAIHNVSESTFLKGGSESGWTITFDWFVKPNNFPKVLDGNYADRHTAAAGKGSGNRFNDCQRADYDFGALEADILANGGDRGRAEKEIGGDK